MANILGIPSNPPGLGTEKCGPPESSPPIQGVPPSLRTGVQRGTERSASVPWTANLVIASRRLTLSAGSGGREGPCAGSWASPGGNLLTRSYSWISPVFHTRRSVSIPDLPAGVGFSAATRTHRQSCHVNSRRSGDEAPPILLPTAARSKGLGWGCRVKGRRSRSDAPAPLTRCCQPSSYLAESGDG